MSVLGGWRGMLRRWRSLFLAVLYAWFAVDIRTSPFQPWLAVETWQILYWATAAVLLLQWLRPSRPLLHVVIVLFPLVGIVRGYAIWQQTDVSQGFTNSLIVAVLASALYPTWSARLRHAEQDNPR